jgi:hypothetical protein
MSCNCGKRKLQQIDKKYGDDKGVNFMSSKNPVAKLIQTIMQLVFGLIIGCVMMVLVVPLMIYITISMMLGKEININLSDLIKRLQRD